MNDSGGGTRTPRAALIYPAGPAPLAGQAIEVAPGVHWLRMSLPLALNHINLWALEDGAGWTLVDTGMHTEETATAWQSVLSGPLADWLESLGSIRLQVPDDVLVLPSHNEPFRGLHARIDQLIQGHEQALLRLKDALEPRKTAADIFSLLFRRRVDGELLTMATGESVAHLNCLIRRGQAVREVDDSGVAWYGSKQATPPPPSGETSHAQRSRSA
jgi:hypothetical protein